MKISANDELKPERNDEFANDFGADLQNSHALDIEAAREAPAEPKEAETAEEIRAETAEEIRAEIAATRAEMSQTIDALQDKLSPDAIKAQVAEKVHEATIGRAQELVHTASEKLAPATEKLGEATSKLAESAAPAAEAAKAKGLTVLHFASQKPAIIGPLVTAMLTIFWSLYRYAEEDEATLR